MQKTISQFIKGYLFEPIVNVFFPPLCCICECYLPPDHKTICATCWSEIPEFDGILDQSLRNKSFHNLYILFQFEEKIRQLIHLLKYKRHLTLAQYFAREAKIRFPVFNNANYDEIVPVPLYKTRKRERGYNQSEEIAKALSHIFQIPVKSEHLLRTRSTLSQTKMSEKEREQNVRNAFSCPVRLTDSNILLVDDVITTGSTIEACVKALLSAGAKKVDVFAIAHPSINQKVTVKNI